MFGVKKDAAISNITSNQNQTTLASPNILINDPVIQLNANDSVVSSVGFAAKYRNNGQTKYTGIKRNNTTNRFQFAQNCMSENLEDGEFADVDVKKLYSDEVHTTKLNQYTLPTLPTSSKFLMSDTSGVLSWQTVTSGGGGSTYNQDLNTYDSPTFNNLTLSTLSNGYMKINNNALLSVPSLSYNELTDKPTYTADSFSLGSTADVTHRTLTLADMLYLKSSTGNFYTRLKSNNITSDQTYTLPLSYPSTGNSVLTSSVLGNMSWTTKESLYGQDLSSTSDVKHTSVNINKIEIRDLSSGNTKTVITREGTGIDVEYRLPSSFTASQGSLLQVTGVSFGASGYIYDIGYTGAVTGSYLASINQNLGTSNDVKYNSVTASNLTANSYLKCDGTKKIVSGSIDYNDLINKPTIATFNQSLNTTDSPTFQNINCQLLDGVVGSFTQLMMPDEINGFMKISSGVVTVNPTIPYSAITGAPSTVTASSLGLGTTNNVTFNSLTLAGALNANSVVSTTSIECNTLTVSGTVTNINTTNINVTDALVKIANGNTSNINDIGMFGQYSTDSGTTIRYTGLVRDSTDNLWKLVDTVTEPSNTTTYSSFADLRCNNLTCGGLGANFITSNSTDTTISSTTCYINSTNLRIKDSIVRIGDTLTSNTLDRGFFWEYSQTGTKYGGLIFDASEASYYLLQDDTNIPVEGVTYSKNGILKLGTLYFNELRNHNTSTNGFLYMNAGISEFKTLTYSDIGGQLSYNSLSNLPDLSNLPTQLLTTTSSPSFQALSVSTNITSNSLNSGNITLKNGTNGTITIYPPTVLTSHTYSLPSTQGASNTYLRNDGSGNLSWQTVSSGASYNQSLKIGRAHV